MQIEEIKEVIIIAKSLLKDQKRFNSACEKSFNDGLCSRARSTTNEANMAKIHNVLEINKEHLKNVINKL